MGRLDRFRKLERARPDGPDDEPQPQQSTRFDKIEARKDAPEKPPADPFAPPPEDPEVPLELADDDQRALARIKEDRKTKAQKELDLERQRIAEEQMKEEARQDPLARALAKRGAILNLTTTERVYIVVGAVAVIAVLAAAIGPYMWGLAPILIAITLASIFTSKHR